MYLIQYLRQKIIFVMNFKILLYRETSRYIADVWFGKSPDIKWPDLWEELKTEINICSPNNLTENNWPKF